MAAKNYIDIPILLYFPCFLLLAAYHVQHSAALIIVPTPGPKPPSVTTTPTLVSLAATSAPTPSANPVCGDHDSILIDSKHDGMKEHDKIVSLPGQPKGVFFNQYSGYVTVNPVAERALFYYFVESPTKAFEKPLVLWLNGGPGCSSVGYGAFEELGPFRVNKDGKSLSLNDYAWTKEANVIFLESPAGVGYSYSNTTTDYETMGDTKAAHDAYVFLLNWLERFPEYKNREFYIMGESYAGHYVPQLSDLILYYNKHCNYTKINLNGIAIGNAYIDYETAATGQIDYLWSHALIPDEVHKGLLANCDFSNTTLSGACNGYIRRANRSVGKINVYNIYAPLCTNSSTKQSDTTFDPCTDNYVKSYLNLPQVRAALHVSDLSFPWIACNLTISRSWKDSVLSTLPVIKELMDSGLRVWLYSGDVDGVIPVTATRFAINKLKLPVQKPWYPWYSGGEVGGYVVGYQSNLTFVTVRGAGHMVPSDQPDRAIAMLSSFILGNLPASNI